MSTFCCLSMLLNCLYSDPYLPWQMKIVTVIYFILSQYMSLKMIIGPLKIYIIQNSKPICRMHFLDIQDVQNYSKYYSMNYHYAIHATNAINRCWYYVAIYNCHTIWSYQRLHSLQKITNFLSVFREPYTKTVFFPQKFNKFVIAFKKTFNTFSKTTFSFAMMQAFHICSPYSLLFFPTQLSWLRSW